MKFQLGMIALEVVIFAILYPLLSYYGVYHRCSYKPISHWLYHHTRIYDYSDAFTYTMLVCCVLYITLFLVNVLVV